jgi:hypothetical protein
MSYQRKVGDLFFPEIHVSYKYGGAFAPRKNCWVTETSKHARNNKITSVYSSLLGEGQRANEIA